MSVATKNPFALLDDEAPPAPAPVKQEESAPAAAPAAARGTATRGRGGPASRGGKYYPRGGKPQSKDASAPVTEDADATKKFEGREPRDGARGRGRGRGAPRAARGRAFDKHSQTGKTDSDKKIHQSWGGDDGNTELKVEEAAAVDATAEVVATNDWANTGAEATDAWDAPAVDTADAWAAPAADAEAKPEGRPRKEREVEEEDNTLTFDEYLAQQKDKDSVVPKLEARQANDGAEDIFKDAVALTKEEEDPYFVGKAKTAGKPRAKKEEKVFLEIEARFERPDRGGRGGRGGPRGGDRGGDRGRGSRGRGGNTPRAPRQNAASAPVVNVDDQTAFPSLS